MIFGFGARALRARGPAASANTSCGWSVCRSPVDESSLVPVASLCCISESTQLSLTAALSRLSRLNRRTADAAAVLGKGRRPPSQ